MPHLLFQDFFQLIVSIRVIELNQSYLQNNSSNYYQNNSLLTAALSDCSCVPNIPWYDFYSRTLLTIGSPNLFYTSAYSDFLGTDGTIVIVNPNTNNSTATITIVLNDVTTGVIVPEPEQDTTVYSAVVGIPSETTVMTGTSATGPWSPICIPLTQVEIRFIYRLRMAMVFITLKPL